LSANQWYFVGNGKKLGAFIIKYLTDFTRVGWEGKSREGRGGGERGRDGESRKVFITTILFSYFIKESSTEILHVVNSPLSNR
jgi:hypothetical protein